MGQGFKINGTKVSAAEWNEVVGVLRQIDPMKAQKIAEDNEITDVEMNRLLDRNRDGLVRHDDFKGFSTNLFGQVDHLLRRYRFNARRLWSSVPAYRELGRIPEHFWSRKEFVLATVTRYGFLFLYADVSLKKDKEIVLAAVTQNGLALEHADASLKRDEDVVRAAVKQDGRALRYADESLKKNKKIVLAAVEQDGWALEC